MTTDRIADLAHQLGRFPHRIGAASIYGGAGSPEGVQVGAVGSLYLRSDGGTSTTLYVKEAAGAVVDATGTLTGTTIAADDTVTVGDETYTFVATLAAANDVLVGATDSDSLDNLIAAINGDAGEGTTYGTGTVANALATAAAGAGDTMDVTAVATGAAGNGVVTAATLTAGDWAAATLEGGTDDDATGWAAK